MAHSGTVLGRCLTALDIEIKTSTIKVTTQAQTSAVPV